MITKRQFVQAAVAAAATGLGAALPSAVRAQGAWPSRPIRIIVPYAPGGTTDIVGRRVGQRLSEVLGQPVVVENRAGGNTAIGADAVAKAAPDGYTLLFTNDATFVANPVLYPKLSYDVQRDFVPVAPVTYVALALAVNGNAPVNDMKELAAYIKGRKDLSYGSFGAGSQPHLMGEMLNKLTGGELIHVPYKGAGPAITDVMGGQILLTFPAFPTIQGHVSSGRVKVLGVSGDKRVPLVPQVQTFTEAGFKDMDMGAWYAFLAPAGTPREIVNRLNAEVIKALNTPEVKERFTTLGADAWTLSPEQFDAYVRDEIKSNAVLVKAAGLQVQN